ncbi:hypothetical protein ABL78_4634 [Leptomonas seymouri]|uniref:NRDE protein n=1 Tax=Leptomonas seymouri TaxID=5684 RepID=A0A0N0P5R3_LEPSE|nr:hypothetical protein ABL78_4634 [Leptomonas seymouri]|eukprot:KPI86287.1 hypothetical protein ABL78_4634 [Leptomonas seymouri]
MCILAFVSRYCERFPFILIGNRDEQLGRGTRHLGFDVHTGLIWAVDQQAGGSWMGIEPRSGRFAILTNCRRAAAASLTRSCEYTQGHRDVVSSAQPSPLPLPTSEAKTRSVAPQSGHQETMDWRGAAPLSHLRRYTKVVPVRRELRNAVQPDAQTLLYEPPSSRGTIVKNFLLKGELPCATGNASFPIPPRSPLMPPFYAGYNLLTCDTLRTAAASLFALQLAAPSMCYTTNRYGVEFNYPVSPGNVHVLQNSFLDNTLGEPISARLRKLFESACEEVMMPLSDSAAASYSVTDIATRLADACLCDHCSLDTAQMIKEGETANASAETKAAATAVKTTIHSTNPLLGFSEAELQEFFGSGSSTAATSLSSPVPIPFSDGGAALVEAYLQSSILKAPLGGYGTRVQSMVLVERVPMRNTKEDVVPRHMEVIYFCQRDISFEGAEQKCVGAPWITFRINADGSFDQESE